MRSLSLFLLPALLLAQPARRPLDLRSPLQDKMFFVLSALERAPVKDPRLDELAARKRAALRQPGNPIEAMRWTPEEIATVSAVLASTDHLDAALRATGLYQREPVLVSAWREPPPASTGSTMFTGWASHPAIQPSTPFLSMSSHPTMPECLK